MAYNVFILKQKKNGSHMFDFQLIATFQKKPLADQFIKSYNQNVSEERYKAFYVKG